MFLTTADRGRCIVHKIVHTMEGPGHWTVADDGLLDVVREHPGQFREVVGGFVQGLLHGMEVALLFVGLCPCPLA